jgi:type III secretion protein C
VKVEGYQAVDLFKVEAGTVLKVTPHIIRQEGSPDTIKLSVTVQDNQDSEQAVNPGDIPPIRQTKISTQAVVAAGQSLLIGGYYYEAARDSDSGVPVLMSIPLLGRLFKESGTAAKRMERLIMITPRIIHLNDLPNVPERADEKSFHVDPGQPDYEYRTPSPRPTRAGCGVRTVTLDPAALPQK